MTNFSMLKEWIDYEKSQKKFLTCGCDIACKHVFSFIYQNLIRHQDINHNVGKCFLLREMGSH